MPPMLTTLDEVDMTAVMEMRGVKELFEKTRQRKLGSRLRKGSVIP